MERGGLGLAEGAARNPVHRTARHRIGRDSLEKSRTARDQKKPEDEPGRDHRDDLFDPPLTRPYARDVLGYSGAAIRAHAAALDDQVSLAFGAFDLGAQRHPRGSCNSLAANPTYL